MNQAKRNDTSESQAWTLNKGNAPRITLNELSKLQNSCSGRLIIYGCDNNTNYVVVANKETDAKEVKNFLQENNLSIEPSGLCTCYTPD